MQSIIDKVYRAESRRVYATLVRMLGDFDLAEEAIQEAFAAAVEQWSENGIPDNPRAWLVSTGRFKAVDAIRRRSRLDATLSNVAERFEQLADANAAKNDDSIEDDRLRLIFTCCHPAIDPSVQVPLTLREVCGLTTEEIAAAFLTSASTMAQRIVRGKAKIRSAGIPIVVPAVEEMPERLEAVLSVIYLVFNEGYSPCTGPWPTRADLSGEAIRLCRLVDQLLDDPEVVGLLGLMLLQESRRAARATPEGDIILLEDQDRSRWNYDLVAEGGRLVRSSLAAGRIGVYTIQAAIALEHAEARSPAETNWARIVAWYDLLLQASPSPIVELNRAVSLAMRDGPEVGIRLIDEILNRGDLLDYHLAHAARADFCRRLGNVVAARDSYLQAISLANQEPEQRFLKRRLAELG